MTTDKSCNSQSAADSATQWHAQRMRSLQEQAKLESRRSGLVANLRFVLFVFFIGMLAYSEAKTMGGVGLTLAAPPLIGFLIAVVAHQRIREKQKRFEAGHAVHRDAVDRANREWDAVQFAPFTAPPDHPYAHDLDITGHASVAHLTSAVRTPAGRTLLRSWLLEASGRDEILGRQGAVADLVPRRLFREEIEVAARMYVRPNAGSLRQLHAWLNEEPLLAHRPVLLGFSRLSTGLAIGLLIAHLSGFIPFALWLIPVLANFGVSRTLKQQLNPIFARATSGEGAFVAYENVLRLFSAETFAANRLVELESLVRGADWAAPDAISDFRSVASLANARHSFVGAVLQGLMVWDIFVLRRLERWRTRWGDVAKSWFDVAAEVEVLSAFAGLSDDNPGWCLPDIEDRADAKLVARGMGHPLLAPQVRIPNDLTIGPRGTFVFVTGSNMSGKSTLLRAVGCNVVLGQAGAPVCCESLTLPVVQLHTNMRVTDSLATGESYYLAALRRLKVVIDAARQTKPPDRQVLYLLDEILQGTNSAERKIAVQGVMRELVELHAIGAITSHDLSLIDEPDLEAVAESVHFTETVSEANGESVMTFDYKLRPGIAPSQNALRLMEIIGLRPRQS